jgi:hypothetical protein
MEESAMSGKEDEGWMLATKDIDQVLSDLIQGKGER